jgi:hypothetical protein
MTGWSVLQSNSDSGGAASLSVTYTSHVTSGTKLIAFISWGAGGSYTITSVKDAAGNAMTQVAFVSGVAPSDGGDVGAAWYAMDTPAGDVGISPDITVVFSGSGGISPSMLIQEVSGLLAGNTTAMMDGTPSTTVGSPDPAVAAAYSSTAAGEYLVAMYGDEGEGVTWTVPSGYTADANSVNDSFESDIMVASRNSSNGSETASIAVTSGIGNAVILGAFQLAAGGGAAPTVPFQQQQRGWRNSRRYRRPQQIVTVPLIAGPGTESGPFNVTVPLLTPSLSALRGSNGSFTPSAPVLTASLAGKAVHRGPLTLTLPVPGTSLAAADTHTGAFTLTLPVPASSIAGGLGNAESGPFTPTLPLLTVSLAGTVTHRGMLTPLLPAGISSLAGKITHRGTLSPLLPVDTASLSGRVTHRGTLGPNLPLASGSLAGKITHRGSIAANFPALTASLNGKITHAGTLSLQLPVPLAGLAGTDNPPNPPVTGSLVLVLPPGRRLPVSGTFSPVLPSLVYAAPGLTPALPLPATELAATVSPTPGMVTITGTLTMSLPVAATAMQGIAQQNIAGGLLLALPLSQSAVAGAVTHVGSLELNLGSYDELSSVAILERVTMPDRISARITATGLVSCRITKLERP